MIFINMYSYLVFEWYIEFYVDVICIVLGIWENGSWFDVFLKVIFLIGVRDVFKVGGVRAVWFKGRVFGEIKIFV